MNEPDSKQMDTSEVPVVTCDLLRREERKETKMERKKIKKYNTCNARNIEARSCNRC
jgi:hypothetical protein